MERSPTLTDADERALIARLRSGEVAALGTLHERLGGAMSTLAASMLRDRTEAEDVVEEALVRVFHAAPAFRGERGLRTWTLRIVANLCRDRLRRRRRITDVPLEATETHPALAFDPMSDWDQALDRRVVSEALEAALAELPVEQREAVVLRHRIGLSHEEMAETLAVPVGTVKSRIARGLAALRTAMKERMKEQM
jgi:RNA polymerase sigma-70 factor (ECF subfamily)